MAAFEVGQSSVDRAVAEADPAGDARNRPMALLAKPPDPFIEFVV